MVLITLEAVGAGTRIALVHTGWDQYDGDQIKAIRDALAGGCGSYVLPQLKCVRRAESTVIPDLIRDP